MRRTLTAGGLLALSLIAVLVMLAVLASDSSLPPTNWLARQYLSAVVRRDVSAASRLGVSQLYLPVEPVRTCWRGMEEKALREITQFGGVHLRNVQTETFLGTGSSDSYQYARISFDYQEPGETTWRPGQLWVASDKPPVGLRYLCGEPGA
jgi:hypothetical protein